MRSYQIKEKESTKNYVFLDRHKMAFINEMVMDNQDSGGKEMKNLIKIKRWEAGLKQYELAFLLGCSAPYLSMVENNRVDATDEFKQKAAELFGMAKDDLFAEKVSQRQAVA